MNDDRLNISNRIENYENLYLWGIHQLLSLHWPLAATTWAVSHLCHLKNLVSLFLALTLTDKHGQQFMSWFDIWSFIMDLLHIFIHWLSPIALWRIFMIVPCQYSVTVWHFKNWFISYFFWLYRIVRIRDGRLPTGKGGFPAPSRAVGRGWCPAPPRPVKMIKTAGKLRGKIKARI